MFTDDLRARTAATWSAAITHRFVNDLWAGIVPEPVMQTYISQDYLFCDAFVALMGAAVSNADTPDARVKIARQLGFIANDEDSYFLRALERLLGPEGLTPSQPLAPTRGFLAIMDEARKADYAASLTVLLVAEWLYLDWAIRTDVPPAPADWLYTEWIDLHRGDQFENWVQLLKDEVNRVAAAADEATRERMGKLFERAVALELAFFEEAYENPHQAQ